MERRNSIKGRLGIKPSVSPQDKGNIESTHLSSTMLLKLIKLSSLELAAI